MKISKIPLIGGWDVRHEDWKVFEVAFVRSMLMSRVQNPPSLLCGMANVASGSFRLRYL